MKILVHSNPPWAGTGYGTQTALLAPRLAAAGHDVVISSLSGLAGRPVEWEGITCLPSGNLTYSNDVLHAHAATFFGSDPGLILVLYDAWAVEADALEGHATAVWSPVHSKPMSIGDRVFYEASGAQPIAMSRYGETQMRQAGLQPCYVPHGIDLATFRPLDTAERASARSVLGVPEDAFMVAMAAANKGTSPPRKAWGEAFTAFAAFHRKHRDAVLFVHTQPKSPFGIDLRPIAAGLGITKAVMFSADYPQITGLYAPGYVAGVLGSADVFLNPSYGEGFGLPTVEAQACGTPVIVGDNSAQTELCGAGWAVECQPFWVPSDQAWWHVPRIKAITGALEKAYRRRSDLALRAKARQFAAAYDVDGVFTQHWKPVLDMLEQYAGAASVALPGRNHGTVPLPTLTVDGLTWIHRGRTHTDDWTATGYHEEELAPVLDALLPAGGVYVDVGAHIGEWALRLSRKASRVIAVEASPDTAAVLAANIALNHITNIEIREFAAWDEPASLSLSDPNGRITGGSTQVIPSPGGTVPARRLDEELAAEDRIDLVKVDVEGADLHVLAGMSGLLERHQPNLLIEDHSVYGYYAREQLTGLLTGLGYSWREVTITITAGPVRGRAPYLVCAPAPRGQAEQTARTAVLLGASQHEGELARLVDAVTAATPQVIAEIGCDSGGTLYAWRQAAPAAAVYGITLPGNSYGEGGSGQGLNPHGAAVRFGDSHDPVSLEWLTAHLAGRPVDVLVIDGDHTPAGVAADLAAYGPLVRTGGLICLHDITETTDERSRVWQVWPALKARYTTIEITMPGGFGWGIIHVQAGDTFEEKP